MIRTILLYCVISGLAVYAWRDWYKSLCGLIVIVGVIRHPDMPRNLYGIQGLNPWNILLFFILLAWLVNRHSERLTWDMPRKINTLLILYLGMVLVGFLRMMMDSGGRFMMNRGGLLAYVTTSYLISEYFINNIKWVIPGLLLFDGCRSRSRLLFALGALLSIYLLFGIQVIKRMPFSAAVSGGALESRSAKIIQNEIGYNRVNMAMMLAGASWAFFSAKILAERRNKKILIISASVMLLVALLLTAGRMGYVTWGLVGLVLCSIRWRKMIPAAVAIVFLVIFLVPGSVERLSKGFSEETRDSNDKLEGVYESNEDKPDLYTIMSGRNIAWQFVIPKIANSPFIGYGRQAMIRTGTAYSLWQNFKEEFPHPHNAYLELLLDNGLAGFLIIIPFYWLMLKYSLSLFRDLRSPVFVAVGGVSSALLLALLFASFGSQTFYPREGAVGMWCAIGLMLRVYVERTNVFRVVSHTPGGKCEASDRDRAYSLFGPFTDNAQGAYSKRGDGRLRLGGRIE